MIKILALAMYITIVLFSVAGPLPYRQQIKEWPFGTLHPLGNGMWAGAMCWAIAIIVGGALNSVLGLW